MGNATVKASGSGMSVSCRAGGFMLANGSRAVLLPGRGAGAGCPGPVMAWSLNGAEWTGISRLVNVPRGAAQETAIDLADPACARWRTVFRWNGKTRLVFSAEWKAGSDTICVIEDIDSDTDAWIEWSPFGEQAARAYAGGGGENAGPMKPLAWRDVPGVNAALPRVLARLSHISYHNQWSQGWVGFIRKTEMSEETDSARNSKPAPFFGVFSGWGSQWRRRGHVRIEVVEDERGHLLRMPLKAGRRCYGLVITNTDPRSAERSVLNLRKTEYSDLSPAKTKDWMFDIEPGPRKTRLLRDPLPATLHLRSPKELLDSTAAWEERARNGGYEGIVIVHGRELKSLAFDLDALWALGRIGADEYRRIARSFLLLAYIFSDPDYCRYGDFWPSSEPDEGIAEALSGEMGDCPVPPNFASEYFSTVGVVAELFPHHPMADTWRTWTIEMTDRFLETFFEDDGTYHESVNYHAHAVSELICFFYPLWLHGGRDFFRHPGIKGSFRHFVELQMPFLADHGCAPLPANGNSGSEGREQPFNDALVVAASVYKVREPKLAANIVHAWQTGGSPRQNREHPVLTEAVLDTAIEPAAAAWKSCHRNGLGVVSKARMKDGSPVWCLFRAGRATHHMDFDQGGLHLAAWDRVLLGDHGYQTRDSDGQPLFAAATWLHSTVTYGQHRDLSSGYTGLEIAPEPALVHICKRFDWVVHRIVNDNYRDMQRFRYNDIIPAPRTAHVRHYLFVKPDYFLVWDVFEEAHGPAVFRLTPKQPVSETGPGVFRAGAPGEPHLHIQFLLPENPVVVENRRVGPLWTLAVRGETGAQFMALLEPRKRERKLSAVYDIRGNTISIRRGNSRDEICLPPPGNSSILPRIVRRAAGRHA